MADPQTSESWPLGVCVLPDRIPNRARTVQYAGYVLEVLEHAGVCHTRVAADQLVVRLGRLRMLLTVYDQPLADDVRAALQTWVERGGAWIAVGGTCGMPELFGVEAVAPAHASWGGGVNALGEGYLVAREPRHPIIQGINDPLHYFNGVALAARNATVLADALDSHGRTTGKPLVFERRVGDGRCVLFAPDITGTIVHVQNGIPVARDGVPAPDGTAPRSDGVLKSDDGHVLDWHFDRDPIPGAPGLSAFLRPVADLWRDVLLRGVFYLAKTQGVALPVLWHWPRGLQAVAHMSHDTDGNEPAAAEILLETLAKHDVRTTWCVILPGYDASLISRIREEGHELAMHYDAMSEGLEWSEAQFERQWRELTAMFGGERPVTNKNHYLRWQGDTELLEWCESRGIKMDQSKGASKTGEAGFNFGTCHPYFTVTFDGRTIDVLELPTPTQDLTVFAPEAILEPLLASAKAQHGVLHLLFHPGHLKKAHVPPAVERAIVKAKEAGLEWWTAKRINEWERARRKVRWSAYSKDSVTIETGAELRDATVLWLDGSGEFEAWGFRFRANVVTLGPAAKAVGLAVGERHE